jgi:hypothetical protein
MQAAFWILLLVEEAGEDVVGAGGLRWSLCKYSTVGVVAEKVIQIFEHYQK